MSVVCFVKSSLWEWLEFLGLNCPYRTLFLPQISFASILLSLCCTISCANSSFTFGAKVYKSPQKGHFFGQQL